MKEYTIKDQLFSINYNDCARLTKLYICYELSSISYFKDFDFCDEFINAIHNCYIENDNYCDVVCYCHAIHDYCDVEGINPADITEVGQLYDILYEIY